jgi:hypothetical protein
MMSDEAMLANVRRLNDYVNRLNGLLNSVSGLDFTQFRLAGTNNWAGNVKSNQFDDEYHGAAAQLAMAGPEIEDAISACQSKMYSLAWSIKDFGMKAEALAITIF